MKASSKGMPQAGAPATMAERGMKTDRVVMSAVKAHAGQGVREIANALNWSNGRVDGSINRLVEKGMAKVQHVLKRGVLIKKVYPADYAEPTNDCIEIPKGMIEGRKWAGVSAKVYALNRTTIGIAPSTADGWEGSAFVEDAPVADEEGKIVVRLPKRVMEFYQLENSETSISANDDMALLTIEGTVVPVALPATYSGDGQRTKPEAAVVKAEAYELDGSRVSENHAEPGIHSKGMHFAPLALEESRSLRSHPSL